MTTLVAVQKDGFACLAADSLTSFGDLRLTDGMSVGKGKLLRVGDAVLGIPGSSAHGGVLASYFARLKRPPRLGDRKEIFEAWRKLHVALKDDYFLNPKDEAADPYESTQLTALVVGPRGIFGVFSLREVFEFSRFWALGSGRDFALGALEALYDRLPTAREVAEAAVAVACVFDKGSSPPVESEVVRLDPGAGALTPPRRTTGRA